MINRLVHGEIHELRLERPPVNALSPGLLRLLAEEVRCSPERGARAVVLSGGEGIFSGGLDVPVLIELDRDGFAEALEHFFDAIEALAASKIPVAAAITGHSPAGGAVLALCCDWRVMAEGDFTIGLNEVRIGIPIPDLVADLAIRAAGARVGERLCVSGRLLSPEEALAVGFVDALAPAAEVVSAALGWCEQTIEVPEHALLGTRSVLRRDLVEKIRGHRKDDARRLTELWFQPELRGAMQKLVARLKNGQASNEELGIRK
jgi:enoyl-CoA hydratase/carnithine racemase